MTVVAILNAASVVSGIVAAGLWLASTKVRVEPEFTIIVRAKTTPWVCKL